MISEKAQFQCLLRGSLPALAHQLEVQFNNKKSKNYNINTERRTLKPLELFIYSTVLLRAIWLSTLRRNCKAEIFIIITYANLSFSLVLL